MNIQPPGMGRRVLRTIGSLWFAAVLLVLLLFGMACATVYESMLGTERALFWFYRAWWFTALLCLFSINVLAGVAARFPFNARHIGFLFTHVSLVVILAGALSSRYFAVDGTIALTEGQSAGYFSVPQDTLTLVEGQSDQQLDADLSGFGIGGFKAINAVHKDTLSLNDLSIDVLQYLPDSEIEQRAVNDAPQDHLAIEVTLASDPTDAPTWVYEDQPVEVGPTMVAIRKANDDVIQRLLHAEGPERPGGLGTIVVEVDGQSYELNADDCRDTAQPVGATGMTLKLLHYYPHATVGQGGSLVNASSQPVNPAIEVQIDQGGKLFKRVAFAKFPDFQSMHETDDSAPIHVVFRADESVAPLAPVEVLVAPSGEMYARLSWEGAPSRTQAISVGEAITTPWGDREFIVRRKFDHARRVSELVASTTPHKDREPALKVALRTQGGSQEMWLQRRRPRSFSADGKQYQLMFGDKIVQLGFDLRLDKFRVGYYPGGMRPRSFESTVTINDPARGGAQTRLISMNHPASFGGFKFFQSSYRMGKGPTVSFLSVSRDPGMIIVFIGYFGVMLGMLIVLINRASTQMHSSQAIGNTQRSNGRNGKHGVSIPLIDVDARCQSYEALVASGDRAFAHHSMSKQRRFRRR